MRWRGPCDACPSDGHVARVVGREQGVGEADGGRAQGTLHQRHHPTVMWAKFAAPVEGSRLASERLWRA
jgi:5-methyltetrahydropteroyltriglutamate--homocysteine methyltransferase